MLHTVRATVPGARVPTEHRGPSLCLSRFFVVFVLCCLLLLFCGRALFVVSTNDRHALTGVLRKATIMNAEPKALISLVIMVREWRDRTYGNTYYSASIIANGEHVYTLPMTYGHGELTAVNRAGGVLRELGYTLPPFAAGKYKDVPYPQDYREAGVLLTIETTTVRRRRDLHR